MVDGVLDGAQYAGDRIEDFGDSAATTARGLRRDASYKFDVAGDALYGHALVHSSFYSNAVSPS